MGRFRKSQRRRLQFESLEHRRVMAGNVTVNFDSSLLNLLGQPTLLISGDAAANQIEVKGTGVAGELLLTPLPDPVTGVPTTTINGSSAPLLIRAVDGDVRIDVGAGDDRLFVHTVTFANDLQIYHGTGADDIDVGKYYAINQPGEGDVAVTGKFLIDAVVGDDTWGEVPGDGADNIFFGRFSSLRFEAHTRGGNDYLQVYNARIKNLMRVYTDGGDDNINFAYITGSTLWLDSDDPMLPATMGHDLVSLITSAFVDVRAYVEAGYNTVALQANNFSGKLRVWGHTNPQTYSISGSIIGGVVDLETTLSAADSIKISSTTFGSMLKIVTDGGNDYVEIQGNVINTFYALLGDGYDTLVFRNNDVFEASSAYGGALSDSLYNSGNLIRKYLGFLEFEYFAA